MFVVLSVAPGNPVTPVGCLEPWLNFTWMVPRTGGGGGGGAGPVTRFGEGADGLSTRIDAAVGVAHLHHPALELLDRADRFGADDAVLANGRQGTDGAC